MKLILVYSSMILSNMFFFANHPISIVILIIIQSLTLCLMIFFALNAGWFSLIMFLIFMGGLMVLFIYIASLASNEMFLINTNLLFSIVTILFVSIIIWFKSSDKTVIFNQSMNFKVKIFPVFTETFFSPTLITMLYLLLTLIITVNIIKLYNAPMRSIIS